MKIIRKILFITVAMISCQFSYASTNITVTAPDLSKSTKYSTLTFPEINQELEANIISIIIGWMIGLTAVLTILAITWAGIQMVLAIGEEEKMKKARHTMIYAFIGLIISGLAYALVTLVTNLSL